MESIDLAFFATCPRGTADLVAAELRDLGAQAVKEQPAGAAFRGTLERAYRACLWSRVANRVLMPLARFQAPTPESLYTGTQSVDWGLHLTADDTLAVDCASSHGTIGHTHYAAQKVKDAIVDQLRDATGQRPNVQTYRPSLQINVHLDRDVATVAIDLSGESLHRRGYRAAAVAAPLKENLAAAMLLRAGWPEVAASGGPLLDPLCGSGTLPIEAALIAADIAPGLLRDYFGFLGWRGHDPALWSRLIEEARRRRDAGLARLKAILGWDHDPDAVRAARANVERAGLAGRVQIERREFSDGQISFTDNTPGLVVANPPYGERLGEGEQLAPLYQRLGATLKRDMPGWQAAVLTGNPPLGKHLGLKARRVHTLWNGAIECRLLRFAVLPEWFVVSGATRANPVARAAQRAAASGGISPGAAMFANRLRKNLKSIRRWAQREAVSCYRTYDADMPEYALAIDLYHDTNGTRHAHVQEYAAPPTVDPERARERLEAALSVLPEVIETPADRIAFKRRRRNRGVQQYGRQAQSGEFIEVAEGGCRFLVNLRDYLDTGLFLDHRPTRALIGNLARGRRHLNLFCYTATATVHAARGGAPSSLSIDMSHTYLDWARRNLELNGLDARHHRLLSSDVLRWLELNAGGGERFGVIFLDPPTFSTSKRMEDILDLQRQHVDLIRKCLALLEPGGVLVFSTHYERFKLDRVALADVDVVDLTATTIPQDFARHRRVHQCFRITQSLR